jgi:hypothetical protein
VRRQGLIDEEQWQSFATSLAFLTRPKAFWGWWALRGHEYPGPFRDFVESHLES